MKNCNRCDHCDPPDFHKKRKHTLTKWKACSKCNRTLTIKERYLKVVGLWNKRFHSMNLCTYCETQLPYLCWCEYWKTHEDPL
jgi:hypothetical protein